jgi:hypothetical protein
MAGLIVLHRRVTILAGLDVGGQVLLALLFAGPALWLAATQVFPDLLSGVFLAIGLIELGIIEKRRRFRTESILIVAIVAAFIPWLQIKNIAPAVVLTLVFSLTMIRFGRASYSSRVAYGGLMIIGLSWLILRWYNLFYFGHLLGFPERPNRFGKQGLEYTLGLLLDRHQGLFVQVPFAIVGLIGLWTAKRKYPGAVGATVVALGAVLVLNGTYTINPYGGGSLAGRFMWTLLPALLAWVAVALRGWQDSARRLWAPALIVGLAWAYQAWPIFSNEHVYYNAVWYFQHPDKVYPGWWQGFNSIVPQFNVPGHFLGTPSWSVAVELAAGIIVVGAIMVLLKYEAKSILDSASLDAVMLMAVWSWRRWRARHFVWIADIDYRRTPTDARAERRAYAIADLNRIEAERPAADLSQMSWLQARRSP